MPGKLKGEDIIVEDEKEAGQLYSKGYFGNPQSGGGVKLNLIEAIYLTEVGKLKVYKANQPQNQDKLFRLGNKQVENFEINYIVYRDLRQRGYVVKKGSPPLDFRVLPRGGIPNKNPSKYWVLAISERGEFDISRLIEMVEKVKDVKKDLLLAVVDEEGDITYYRTKMVTPHGQVKSDAKDIVAEALMLRDRVLVLDECEAQMLHNIEFFGKLVGASLHLSLLETAYLLDRGLIKVRSANTGKFISTDILKKMARKAQPDFDLRLQIYADLKDKGILVKTGFKYGSHFRAYTGDPETNHAKYLVHSIPENYVGMWAEISRAVRLAHGVKKEILLGRQKGTGAEYLRLRRVRP
ncbi:MAG: tRNA-intron lyase [Thermoplasmata archaeon]|nr:tRNA-intron lyase [Thermoplasmata archaeon]